jgi:transposase
VGETAMVKQVTINQSDQKTLYSLYRSSSDGTSRSHYQILWLISEGKTVAEVSESTGYSRNWIYQLVRRFERKGVSAVGDQRKNNGGQNCLLTDFEQAQLWSALSGLAPDGGLWNGRKVADWLSELTGKEISRHRGWEILKQMGYRLRVPRPEHRQGDEVEKQEWKKNCKNT